MEKIYTAVLITAKKTPRLRSLIFSGLFLSIIFYSVQTSAQQTQTGIPWTGDYGVTVTVDEIMSHEVPIRSPRLIIPREHELHLHKIKNPDAPAISSYPPIDNSQNRNGEENTIAATQSIGVSFPSITFGVSGGYIPPDCNGAAGPTQILAVANSRIRVYSKTGVLGALDVTTNTFFTSVRNGAGMSDCHIRYDRPTQKWFVVGINVASADNRVVIAVSSGPVITGTASFTFFYFVHSAAPPAGDAGKFLDYPTLGVDANALYIGGVRFTASFDGTPVFVVRKSSVTGAGPIVVTAFRNAGGLASGIVVPQGVDNDDPGATEGYFVGTDAGVYSKLNFLRVNTPGGTPTITNLTPLTVPANNNPILQVHAGVPANNRLDGLDDRLFAAHVMKNKLTGVTTLWTSHTTKTNSSGVASGTMDRNASRWYQIGNINTATPTLIQSGTQFDNAGTNPRGFWNSSIAMSGQGHAAIGFSTAGNVNYADAAIAGRYSSDASGTLQPFALATTSTTAYNLQSGTDGKRWGDYSQVVVDPNDNMTMWTFQEYCDAVNSWCVRVLQIIAPPPPPTASLNPLPTVGITASVTVNIVANSTPNNTGFFDPGADVGGPGYANHITASVTGGITVNSITFIDATHVNLNLNTSGAVPGTYTITITNPDGQTTTIQITVTGSTLPVELISFTGQASDRGNLLKWTTVSENNNDFFIVERSRDARQFDETGKIKGAGYSNILLNYSFWDTHPFSGITYYRLKQMDFNYLFTYSHVISVNNDRNVFELVNAYINFADQSIVIYFNDNMDEQVSYQFADSRGKIIYRNSQSTIKGVNKIELDAKQLVSGIYFITVNNGKNIFSKKIFY